MPTAKRKTFDNPEEEKSINRAANGTGQRKPEKRITASMPLKHSNRQRSK
jgi:hypothetical protein